MYTQPQQITPVEPVNAIPLSDVSESILSMPPTGFNNRNDTQEQRTNSLIDDSVKQNGERLNRANFFLENIATNLSYVEIFTSIIGQYPLVESDATNNAPKIKYLCTAGNVCFHMCCMMSVNSRHLNIDIDIVIT